MNKFASASQTFYKITPLDPNSTMARAYFLMDQHRSPNLPVGSGDEVVGVICERDIEALIKNYSTITSQSGFKVGNFMRGPVRSVDIEGSLMSIAQLMLNERAGAVVVKRGDDVVGAITKDDLIEVLTDILKDDRRSLLDSLAGIKASFLQRRKSRS